MTDTNLKPIPLDPRDGGALNWFDLADEQGRVVMELFTQHPPKTPKALESWLIQKLRNDMHQSFFFRTLAHKGMKLDSEILHQKKHQNAAWSRVYVRVPLAQLFLLPNENPQQELEQLRGFLQWVDDNRQTTGRDGREATIQWFRGGYRSRGLEWAGVAEVADKERLNQELDSWREKPWFQQWYQANMDGLAKVRMGPHCWFSMASLVQDRFYQQLRNQALSKPHKP